MSKLFFGHLLVFILAFADDFFDLLIDFINRLGFFVIHFDGFLARQKLVPRKAHGDRCDHAAKERASGHAEGSQNGACSSAAFSTFP